MTGLRGRFFWPVTLITLCLVSLCVVTAVSLFHEQATIARVLRETVASRRAAVELEECLHDLIALENNQVAAVAPLHARARDHVRRIQSLADQPEEKLLAARVSGAFAAYLDRWTALPAETDPGYDPALREATRVLEMDVLRPCQEFRQFNGQRIEDTTSQHERVLRQLAWGMAGVAGLGGVAGLVLGYGVARGLSQSIRRLQVRIRDAAGKLGPELPEIVLTGDAEFGELHDQIDRLTTRIEEVVQQLQEREREVLRAEQLAAVGQLAAGVGHEIRNPLTSIKMLVQAGMEEGGPGGLTPEDLQVIEAEIRRMERSLQTFLDFARPPKAERRSVDLLAVVGAVLGLVRGRTEKQRVTARVAAPPGGVALTADAGQIQQVLVNLVLNALDAMPTGGALILTVRRAGGWVEVEVADTGPGVGRDVMPRLFQPFVSGKETGLGLGLVISRRIIEDHGGTLDAANRLGGGASFFIRLPLGEK
ncbi:MAG: zraS 3 [Gemmataceae bacterium]|nr:zraS 3 [Gemmataceae bacterium]